MNPGGDTGGSHQEQPKLTRKDKHQAFENLKTLRRRAEIIEEMRKSQTSASEAQVQLQEQTEASTFQVVAQPEVSTAAPDEDSRLKRNAYMAKKKVFYGLLGKDTKKAIDKERSEKEEIAKGFQETFKSLGYFWEHKDDLGKLLSTCNDSLEKKKMLGEFADEVTGEKLREWKRKAIKLQSIAEKLASDPEFINNAQEDIDTLFDQKLEKLKRLKESIKEFAPVKRGSDSRNALDDMENLCTIAEMLVKDVKELIPNNPLEQIQSLENLEQTSKDVKELISNNLIGQIQTLENLELAPNELILDDQPKQTKSLAALRQVPNDLLKEINKVLNDRPNKVEKGFNHLYQTYDQNKSLWRKIKEELKKILPGNICSDIENTLRKMEREIYRRRIPSSDIIDKCKITEINEITTEISNLPGEIIKHLEEAVKDAQNAIDGCEKKLEELNMDFQNMDFQNMDWSKLREIDDFKPKKIEEDLQAINNLFEGPSQDLRTRKAEGTPEQVLKLYRDLSGYKNEIFESIQKFYSELEKGVDAYREKFKRDMEETEQLIDDTDDKQAFHNWAEQILQQVSPDIQEGSASQRTPFPQNMKRLLENFQKLIDNDRALSYSRLAMECSKFRGDIQKIGAFLSILEKNIDTKNANPPLCFRANSFVTKFRDAIELWTNKSAGSEEVDAIRQDLVRMKEEALSQQSLLELKGAFDRYCEMCQKSIEETKQVKNDSDGRKTLVSKDIWETFTSALDEVEQTLKKVSSDGSVSQSTPLPQDMERLLENLQELTSSGRSLSRARLEIEAAIFEEDCQEILAFYKMHEGTITSSSLNRELSDLATKLEDARVLLLGDSASSVELDTKRQALMMAKETLFTENERKEKHGLVLEINKEYIKTIIKELEENEVLYVENKFSEQLNKFKGKITYGNIENTNTVKQFWSWWKSEALKIRQIAQNSLEKNKMTSDNLADSITQLKDLSDKIQQLKDFNKKNSAMILKLVMVGTWMEQCPEGYEENPETLKEVPNIKKLRRQVIDFTEFNNENALKNIGTGALLPRHRRNQPLPESVPDTDLLVLKVAQGMRSLCISQDKSSAYTDNEFEQYVQSTTIIYSGNGKFKMAKDDIACKYEIDINLGTRVVDFSDTKRKGTLLHLSDLWWGDCNLLLSILKGNRTPDECSKVEGLDLAHKDHMAQKLDELGIRSAFGIKKTRHMGIINEETNGTIRILKEIFKTEVFVNNKNHETYPAFLAMLSTHLSYRSLFATEHHFTELKITKIEEVTGKFGDKIIEVNFGRES